jgi:hypothetical protein
LLRIALAVRVANPKVVFSVLVKVLGGHPVAA